MNFIEKYNFNIDFVTYAGVKLTILEYIEKSKIPVRSNIRTLLTAPLKKLYSVHKGSRLYYDSLIKNTDEPNCCLKWNTKLNFEINWKDCFRKVKKISDITLKWLQIRIVHRIIATNIVLKEMGIVQTNKCSFCEEEKDSIQHMFWNCNCVHTF